MLVWMLLAKKEKEKMVHIPKIQQSSEVVERKEWKRKGKKETSVYLNSKTVKKYLQYVADSSDYII